MSSCGKAMQRGFSELMYVAEKILPWILAPDWIEEGW
jgi:hypothetical protein